MQDEVSILEGILDTKPRKSRWFNIFIIASCLFLLLTTIQFYIDLNIKKDTSLNWSIFVVIIILPALGVIFFGMGKRIGWILSMIYYTFLLSLTLFAFLTVLFTSSTEPGDGFHLESFILLVLSMLAVVLLCIKANRIFFRINKLLLIICILIALSMGGLLVYYISKAR